MILVSLPVIISPRTVVSIASASVLAGVAMMVIGWFIRDAYLLVGNALILIGLVTGAVVQLRRVMIGRTRGLDDMFERGREVGYNRGYWEGRRHARPVLVQAQCPHCGHDLSGRHEAAG